MYAKINFITPYGQILIKKINYSQYIIIVVIALILVGLAGQLALVSRKIVELHDRFTQVRRPGYRIMRLHWDAPCK